MRQEHFSSREGGSKSIITERYRKLVYAAMAATALGVSACGGENPNNNPDGGAGTGGGGTGGTTEGGGGTGGGGANPCEGLMFEGLAGEEVSPGETGTVTVDLGESHPDKAYNGLRMEINGDVLTKPGLAGLMKKTDVTANGDYQLVEMKGFRTLVIDKENNYRLNESGNCELNTLEVNQSVMNDINKRPVVTLPPGLWLSSFRVQEGKGVPEDFELTAEGTRSRISELNGEGYFPANSKPVVVSKITRDQDGHIVVDLAGTTDEGDGSDTVLEKLGVMASDGLVFAKMPDGTYRSTDPSSLGSFDLSVAGLSEGVTDDTTAVNVNVPPKPEISNLAIDCNTGGACVANWPTPYPVTFTVSDALNCTADAQVFSGPGTPGSVSGVSLNGQNGSFTWSTGSTAGDTIRLTVDCVGNGGENSTYVDQIQD